MCVLIASFRRPALTICDIEDSINISHHQSILIILAFASLQARNGQKAKNEIFILRKNEVAFCILCSTFGVRSIGKLITLYMIVQCEDTIDISVH